MPTKSTGPKGLKKLLEDQLADLYYVEKQLVKALPKMARAARNEELKEAISMHLHETEGHVRKLEQVFRSLGRTPKARKCPAIDGILEEGKELMETFKEDPGLDAGLIAGGRKVEHYEIATYGSAAAWADELGLTEVKDLLGEILEEEKAADDKLAEIGRTVNTEAVRAEEEHEIDEAPKGHRPSRSDSRKPMARMR